MVKIYNILYLRNPYSPNMSCSHKFIKISNIQKCCLVYVLK
ncbi:hypothetical protein HMPREF2533_01419 [Bacteroides fragilis]|nr:hypothetical protein HMPREF2530_01419 [Bacteroides fragilis]KXU47987.1 hypothetical protein HMPREF2533_01419 [Bacteroides fragilis]